MGGNQDSYRHLALPSRTGIPSAAHRTLLACHSPPSFDVPTIKKCLGINAAPHAHRDLPQLPEPETLNPALLCRKMPIAPPQPLSPLRCPPRSTDLSILSRSLTRPRKAGQGGRGGRRKGGVVYPRIPTLSARPKASDNLAHHRYSSLASQLSCKQLSQSNRHIFSRCKLEPRMIGEAAHTSSTCGAARQKARPRYREALLCCKECRLSLRHLNLRSGLL